ncbi:hypothetical protein BDN72DRAFT_906966 [Pluteus cervinus]|uniref:Uncharacterized protein n=1 Tax=Pluteus cervinus TaxID=181527 RepID=A0ACD2ZXG1_9AGAR|nr:hypothetical protein BDN72DRAFT_906966 [Pluteus cervinus]
MSPFNKKSWCDALCGTSSYAASSAFPTEAIWQRVSPASPNSTLISKTRAIPFTVVVVGMVDPDRTACGLLGNYTGPPLQLDRTKFDLVLSKPNSENFGSDFDRAVQNLRDLQKATLKTMYRTVEKIGALDFIKLGPKMFKKRKVPLAKPHLDASGAYDQPNADDPTLNWPIPNVYHEAFQALVYEQEITPLRVFDCDGSIIPTREIQDKICGCLVEMAFQLRHYIWADKFSEYYTPDIKQIRVLERFSYTRQEDLFSAADGPVSFGVPIVAESPQESNKSRSETFEPESSGSGSGGKPVAAAVGDSVESHAKTGDESHSGNTAGDSAGNGGDGVIGDKIVEKRKVAPTSAQDSARDQSAAKKPRTVEKGK